MAKKRTRRKKKEDVVEEEAKQEDGGNGVGKEKTDPLFAEDHVQKLTEAELDKFNLLAMKMNHNLQQIRVLELEQERADRNYVAEKHTREQHIKTLRGHITPLEQDYLNFVRSLAKKYKIRPEHLGIDDETGVIRDLTPQEEAKSG
jgi:DNA-binding response OmpR family regulator